MQYASINDPAGAKGLVYIRARPTHSPHTARIYIYLQTFPKCMEQETDKKKSLWLGFVSNIEPEEGRKCIETGGDHVSRAVEASVW